MPHQQDPRARNRALPPSRRSGLKRAVGSFLAALRHLRQSPRHRREASEVERLLREHGASSVAWFALDRDVDYFWSRDRRAVVAYHDEADAMLVIGDPIGPEEKLRRVLEEFAEFARAKGRPFAFFQARPELLPLYVSLGWRALHIGEDPVLWTDGDGRDGAAIAHERRLARHAENEGLRVLHAMPGSDLSRGAFPPALRHELRAVAREWARLRHGDARGFCVGRFDPPRLRQEWLAVAWDPARHRIEAFATWVPIPARRGWALDVVRRRADAPLGALDLLIVSALDHARARGDHMLSLSLAPLAFVPGTTAPSGSNAAPPMHDADGARIVLQQHLTRLYDPGNATAWKRRFDPSFEDRYLVVPEPSALPRIVQALVQAQTAEAPEASRTTVAGPPDRGENEA